MNNTVSDLSDQRGEVYTFAYTFDPVKFMWWLMYVSLIRLARPYPGPVVTEYNND